MWRPITIDDVRLPDAEKAMLRNIQGGQDFGATALLNVVREFDAAGKAGGYETPGDDTVADLCRMHVINRTRWLWLCEFPSLKAFQTEGRKKLNDDALTFLNNVADRKQNIDLPNSATPVPSSANWNSENRLILRTHPIPPASQQMPPATPAPYANPDAPADL